MTWRPHVGCFMWDPEGCIEVPSPFPERIYFILNLGHFIRLLGSLEEIARKLVWLPTWHQALRIGSILCLWSSLWLYTQFGEEGQGESRLSFTPRLDGCIPLHPLKRKTAQKKPMRNLFIPPPLLMIPCLSIRRNISLVNTVNIPF